MQPINVKGELLEHSIQDIQTSVSVISREMLEAGSGFDLYDVIAGTDLISLKSADQRLRLKTGASA